MLELEIGVVDGNELNFDKSFLQFEEKKKYKRYFKRTFSDRLKMLNTRH